MYAQESLKPKEKTSTRRSVVISEKTLENCKLAFEELKASRGLIDAMRREREATERLTAEKDNKITLLEKQNKLLEAVIAEKSSQIESKDAIIVSKDSLLAIKQTRIEDLEKKLSKEKISGVKKGIFGALVGFVVKAVFF